MDALEPGDPRSVGDYRLLGRLGAGGMGQVFLGVSPGGRKVAVKLIHPERAQDAQFRERFAREIRAAQRVGGFHTALVVDADPRADPPWMVTAYVEGPSLQEAVRWAGPLPPDQVRALGAGLAEGLAAIHTCGLVHRDLKPSNVIMAADGPRIIDFGIARAIDASTGMTATGAVVGTFAYMSPEQIRGEVAGPASDVFSLGSVLGFAATGRPPFGSDSAVSIMFRLVNQPPDLAGVADGGLRDVIAACLAKSAGDRPGVRAALGALSSPAPVLVAAGTSPGAVAAAADCQTSTQTGPPARPETSPGHQALPRSGTPPTRAMHARPSRGRPAALITAATIGAVAVIACILALSHIPGKPKPPAVNKVNVIGAGETLQVTAAVDGNGETTRCSVSVVGGGRSSGACGGMIAVHVPMYNTSYLVTYTATNAGGSTVQRTSGRSGLKTLTADATDAFGTCSQYPNSQYCGPNSGVEPSADLIKGSSLGAVSYGQVMTADCWATGGLDYGNVPPYNGGSNVWIRVANSPGPGYMSILWFRNPDSVASGLPECAAAAHSIVSVSRGPAEVAGSRGPAETPSVGSCTNASICSAVNVSVSNFTPGSVLSYECSDNGGQFWPVSGTVDRDWNGNVVTAGSNGDASFTTQCIGTFQSKSGMTLTVTVNGVSGSWRG